MHDALTIFGTILSRMTKPQIEGAASDAGIEVSEETFKQPKKSLVAEMEPLLAKAGWLLACAEIIPAGNKVRRRDSDDEGNAA